MSTGNPQQQPTMRQTASGIRRPKSNGGYSPLVTAIIALLMGDAILATLLVAFATAEVLLGAGKTTWDIREIMPNIVGFLLAVAGLIALLVYVTKETLIPRIGNNRKLTMATVLFSVIRLPILGALYSLTKDMDGWSTNSWDTILKSVCNPDMVDTMHHMMLPICFGICYVAVSVATVLQMRRIAKTGMRLADRTMPLTPLERETCGDIAWKPRTMGWAIATTVIATVTIAFAIALWLTADISDPNCFSISPIMKDSHAWATTWLSPSFLRDVSVFPIGMFIFIPTFVAGALSIWNASNTRPGLAYMSVAIATCVGIVGGSVSHLSAGFLVLSLLSLVPLTMAILSDKGLGHDRSSVLIALAPIAAVAVACVLPSFVPLLEATVLVIMMRRYATVRCNEATHDALMAGTIGSQGVGTGNPMSMPMPDMQPPTPNRHHTPLVTAILTFFAGDAILLVALLALLVIGNTRSMSVFDLMQLVLTCLLCLVASFALLVPVTRKVLQPRFGNSRKLTLAAILIAIARLPVLWLLYCLAKGVDGWCMAGGDTMMESIWNPQAATMLHGKMLKVSFEICYIAVSVVALLQMKRMAATGTRLADGTMPVPVYLTPWEQATRGGTIWNPRTEGWALATTAMSMVGLVLPYAMGSATGASSPSDSAMISILEDSHAWATAWLSPSTDINLLYASLFLFVPTLIAGALSTWRARTERPGLAYMSVAFAICLGIIVGAMSYLSAGILVASLMVLVPLLVMTLSDHGIGWGRSSLVLALCPIGMIAVVCVLPSFVPLMEGAVLIVMTRRYATVRCGEAELETMGTTVMPAVTPTTPVPSPQIPPPPMREGMATDAPYGTSDTTRGTTDDKAGHETDDGLDDIMVMADRDD